MSIKLIPTSSSPVRRLLFSKLSRRFRLENRLCLAKPARRSYKLSLQKAVVLQRFLKLPRIRRFRKAWSKFRWHGQPARRCYGPLIYKFRQKNRPLQKKWKSIRNRLLALFRGHLKRGRRYDFPARYERFRWPSRIRQTKVIDPADIWEVLALKSLAFGIIFRSVHRPQKLTKFQAAVLVLLWSFRKNYYSLEGALPLSSAPSFLFSPSFPFSPQLFSLFWQSPSSIIDRNLLLDNFYSRSPTPTVWLVIVKQLFEDGGTVSRLLLWDFAARELDFWASFFNEILLIRRLTEDDYSFVRLFLHPSWLLTQLDRLAMALPLLPLVVRGPLTANFRRLAAVCQRLWTVERNSRQPAIEAVYGPLGAVRMKSWFIRQTRYMRRLRRSMVRVPAYVKICRLYRLVKRYWRLRALAPQPPTSLFYRLFGAPLRGRRFFKRYFLTTVSRRVGRFIKRRFRIQRRRRKKQSKVLDLPDFGLTPLALKKRSPLTTLRPGGVYVALNKSFLWHLLLLWLVVYFRRFVVGARGHYLSRWLLFANSNFSLPSAPSRLWLLTWAAVGLGRFVFTNSPYRLACLHWVVQKNKSRRRHYFRRWFTGFFYRRRKKNAWYFRPRIPRYYRRFNFIRRLPFAAFRLFWPQSANFARRRVYRRRHQRRPLRPRASSFKLIQPRSMHRIKRFRGSDLTQLKVSRQLHFS